MKRREWSALTREGLVSLSAAAALLLLIVILAVLAAGRMRRQATVIDLQSQAIDSLNRRVAELEARNGK